MSSTRGGPHVGRRLTTAAIVASAVLMACGQSNREQSASENHLPDLVEKPKCIYDVVEWTEEVKLHDGKMITVWRRARACSWGFPNAKRGRDIDFQFAYEPMKVQWRGLWNRDPISFEIFDGVPHLALYIGDRPSCEAKARTDYSAQFLRWIDGKWVDVPQAEFPIDRARMNLSGHYWGHTTKDDYKGLIRWDNKELRGREDGVDADTIKAYFERGKRFCSDYFTN